MRVGLIASAIVGAGTLAAVVAVVVEPARDGGVPWGDAAGAAVVLAWTGVGLLLLAHRRGGPIGPLLVAHGAVLAVIGLADSHAGDSAWGDLIAEGAWPALFIAPTAIAWLFPDGRLPSPRWRRPGLAAAVSLGALLVLALLTPEDTVADSPLPVLDGPLVGALTALVGAGALAGLVGGALAVRTRFRRARGAERQQMKWMVLAAVTIPAMVVVCLAEVAITGSDGPATLAGLGVSMLALPAAVGVAVMRYRLYDIDRLVNRTLVYAVLGAGLLAVFAAVALGVGLAAGGGSAAPTAAATLVAALLFSPLRIRAQRLVDRSLARDRYDGLRVVEAFLQELRAGRADPEEIEPVLARALGDPSLRVRVMNSAGEGEADLAGRPVPPGVEGGRARTPVVRGDLRLATIVHDARLNDRPDLLESVLAAAGLALEIARLRVEVRGRLAEVEASRARIVAAGDAERRRLERDLHDGAQQRLVSIGLALRHLQAGLPPGVAAADGLDAVVGDLAGAIDDLRELARGVRPAGLDDGLGVALRDLAARSPLRTRVSTTEERFAEPVETAAYFVVSEALANAAKHSGAFAVEVTAARRNGDLVVAVRDDGVGGASAAAGSGLAGIGDRVAALGGRLRVVSPAGNGTVVEAELPCGS